MVGIFLLRYILYYMFIQKKKSVFVRLFSIAITRNVFTIGQDCFEFC